MIGVCRYADLTRLFEPACDGMQCLECHRIVYSFIEGLHTSTCTTGRIIEIATREREETDAAIAAAIVAMPARIKLETIRKLAEQATDYESVVRLAGAALRLAAELK